MLRSVQSREPYNFKLITLGIFIVISLLLVLKAIRIMTSSIWDGKHAFAVVETSSKIQNGKNTITLFFVDPNEKRYISMEIPDTVYLTISPTYGEYKASAIGKFSLLEKKNGILLQQAIENSLAVPADGYIIAADPHPIHLTDLFRFGFFRHFLETVSLISNSNTNLSLFDVLRLWLLSFSFKDEEVQQIDITHLDSVHKQTLPDNSEKIIIDTEKFANENSSTFVDSTLKDENLSIEILNGTDTPGLANNLALLLTNSGGNVINTAKADKAPKTTVTTKHKNYTATRLAQITHSEIHIDPKLESRADIIVVLGGQ